MRAALLAIAIAASHTDTNGPAFLLGINRTNDRREALAGANSPFGKGGAGNGNANTAGDAAVGYAAGGGGASSTTTSEAGGTGVQGIVVVYEYR